jgi:hypothetical protein
MTTHFMQNKDCKKIMLLFVLLNAISLCSFSQLFNKTDKQLEEDKRYIVTVGSNKNKASGEGMDGFRIKDNDIRIVGFLHRGNKIEYKELYIETTRDGIVIDSQVVSCCGISAKWRDFYLKLSDVKYSNHYKVTVYVNEGRAVLGSKDFFIKKEYD